MVFNISILYPQVALADASAFAYQDALIPIETFATAVAIGSGIVASKNAEAIKSASGVIAKAIANVKAKACGDASTAFRVIKDGKSEKPENGDDKNNNKWFVRGAAAVAGGSLVAAYDAVRDMMESIHNNNGYKSIINYSGNVKIEDVINQCSYEAIGKQMLEYNTIYTYGGFTAAWKNFKTAFENAGYNINDYFYYVITYTPFYYNSLPELGVKAFKKPTNDYYIKLAEKGITYNTQVESYVSGNNLPETKLYGLMAMGSVGIFFNSDDIISSLDTVIYNGSRFSNSHSSQYEFNSFGGSSDYRTRYCFMYKSFTNPFYTFTNQTYNPAQTQQTNFPDWVQSSIETINGNLEAINLAINNLQLPQTWNDTQTNIQTGQAPANVINQYINYASNPDTAPDPGENPNPEPEPAPTEDYLQGFMLPATITEKFPFCVPFDIAKCLKLFSVSGREAPKWEGIIKYGSKGENEYKVTIDLKDFEPIAKIVRPLEFIVFLVGLIIITRDLIKG